MSIDSPKKRNFKIRLRYGAVIGVMLLLCAFIIHNLYVTSVRDRELWLERIEKDLAKRKTIVPERGDILADDGSVLATNLTDYTVWVDYSGDAFREKALRDSADFVADSLAKYFPVRSAAEWKEYIMAPLQNPDRKSRTRSLKLLSGISWSEYQLLRTFPFFGRPLRYQCGITYESRTHRVNPYGRMASRSIGAVGFHESDSSRRGRWGIEGSLDSLLYGCEGISKPIPLTRGMADWTDVPAIPGSNVTTTININLQELVEQELDHGLQYCGAEWGVAILMDVATGEIKAISNLEYAPGGGGYIEAYNRAVRRYEPGSVVKVLSMLVALEDGLVSGPNDVITTGAVWHYQNDRAISDSHVSETKTAKRVISESSNIGMARIITGKYGADPGSYHDRLERLGLFEPMNSGIKGELCPMVARLPNNRGGRVSLARQSYGYATEFSPLWTLAIYNAIANDGRFVRPHLIKALQNPDGTDSILPITYIRPQICTPGNAAILRDMLADVIENPHGTGHALKSEFVKLAGKTGTCYTIGEGGQYDQSRKRLTFCGFFPADEPKYSCIVMVCGPTQNAFGAAGTSGNIFRSIAHKLFARGLLGNSSNMLVDTHSGTFPTIFASLDGGRAQRLTSLFDITTTVNSLALPAEAATGVPDVRGFGLREAVRTLEDEGYNVAVRGSGYVAAMEPIPGSQLSRGQKVTLMLHP